MNKPEIKIIKKNFNDSNEEFTAEKYDNKEWGIYAKRSKAWVAFGTRKEMMEQVKRLNGNKFNDKINYWDWIKQSYNITNKELNQLLEDYKNLYKNVIKIWQDLGDRAQSISKPNLFDKYLLFRDESKNIVLELEQYLTRNTEDKYVKDHGYNDVEHIAKEMRDYLEDELDIIFDTDENGSFFAGNEKDLNYIVDEGNKWLKIKYPDVYREEQVEIYETQGIVRIVCNE